MSEPRYSLDQFNTIPGYAVGENGAAPDRDSWLPLNLAHLPDHPPIQPTLGRIGNIGLLYPGKRHVFSGPQESAKTLAAYLLALQVIRDGGTVILLDFEMGAYDARARLRDLGATMDDLGRLLYAEPDDPATDDRISILIALNPQLVIVDAAAGAYNIQGLDDNKRADVERLTNLYVRSFWRNGIATIMLDHVVKNTETRGTYAIGSERKVGGADVHLGFSVITPISRGHSGLYKITTHKDRGGYLKRGTLAEMELTSHPDTHAITCTFRPAEEIPEGEIWMPTKQMQKVSELLEQSDEPLSRNNVITTIGGSKDYAAKAIDHLVRLKYATETPGSRGAKLIQTLRSFTVYEWEHQPLPPTSPDLPPGAVPSTSPGTPLRGAGGGSGDEAQRTSPPPTISGPVTYDWIDELTPSETDPPPGDLHDQGTP